MPSGGAQPSHASIPSFASYNIRFLSLSGGQRKQRKRKLRNVRKLVQTHTVVAVHELHCNAIKAQQCFFSEVQGIVPYYEEGEETIAFLANKEWSEEYKPELVQIIPGVMVALRWQVEGRNSWLVAFRLDAKDEKERIRQLAVGTIWAKQNIKKTDVTIFGGDRNFVRIRSEKQNRRSTWKPSTKMNEAWKKYLKSLGEGHEVAQPEFTWGRVVS